MSPVRQALTATLASAALLAGCASTTPADYAAEKPVLDLKTYFNGPLVDVYKRQGTAPTRWTSRWTA